MENFKKIFPEEKQKEKIIYALYVLERQNTEESFKGATLNFLTNMTNIPITTVSKIIYRKDGGLLPDGYIEICGKQNIPGSKTKPQSRYISTPLGKDFVEKAIKKVLEEEERLRITQQRNLDCQAMLELFQNFFEQYHKKTIQEIVSKGRKSILVDFTELSQFDVQLSEKLLEEPEEAIKSAEMAVSNFTEKRLKVRFYNIPKSQNMLISEVRSNHIDKLYCFEATIRGCSPVMPEVTTAKFECPSCGSVISILQVDQQFKEPTRCSCGRKGHFRLIHKELTDFAHLIIEEDYTNLESGEEQKKISVFLKDDITRRGVVKNLNSGNKVRVIGIIKEKPKILRSGKISTRFDLIIEANYLEPIDVIDANFTEEDIKEFKEFAGSPTLFQDLINSIAPDIEGHENIKEAGVLQLAGGVAKYNKQGLLRERGDVNILLVGDPGAAKSAFLRNIINLAPRGKYCVGKNASAAGLIGIVEKDEVLSQWFWRAGAIARSNGGICAIDELDKSEEATQDCLHEPMEQNTLSIDKANINATRKVKVSFLIAMNPRYSRFVDNYPITHQIKIKPSLLDRCDLIFVVRDKADKEKDSKFVDFIIENEDNPRTPVKPKDFLVKYFTYCKTVTPLLEKDSRAAQILKSFWVGKRGLQGVEPVYSPKDVESQAPISIRLFFSTKRLAEASARVRLSDRIENQDSIRAVRIMNNLLNNFYKDEKGRLDGDFLSGFSSSARNNMSFVEELIEGLLKDVKLLPIEELISKAEEGGVSRVQTEEIIERLKREGIIFEPKAGFVGLV